MTMMETEVTSKRLTDRLEWVAAISRRFSEVTGWPLTFEPINADSETSQRASTNGVEAVCWSSEIHDAEGPVGRLQFRLPHDPGQDREFLAICELTCLFSTLISRALKTSDDLDRKSRDLSLLLELESSPRKRTEVAGTLNELLRVAMELTGFRAAAFFLLTPDARQLKLRAVQGVSHGEVPIASRSLDTAPPDVRAFLDESLLIHVDGASVYRPWLPDDCRTAYCVPVISETGPAGTLWLYDRRRRDVGEDDRKIIRSIVSHLAADLEWIVMRRESRLHHRQNHDLLIASQCQREADTTFRTVHTAYDMAALCTSRYELGGDLCDMIPLGERRAFVAVGDASGDSVPAAMVMSAVRGAIRAMIGEHREAVPSPALVLERANETLHDLSATFQFMSLFVGLFDFEAGTLTYSNAGHPSPILIRGETPEELRSHGILLGIMPRTTYDSTTIPVRRGDVLFAYSDGISEAMDEDDRIFGSEGIRRALATARFESAEEILQTVQSHVERWAQHNASGDDRTLLAVRLK